MNREMLSLTDIKRMHRKFKKAVQAKQRRVKALEKLRTETYQMVDRLRDLESQERDLRNLMWEPVKSPTYEY